MKVVTTAHRGVFAGVIEEDRGDTVVLREARMCVSWSAKTKGVLGLASHGPGDGCRVSRSVDRLELRHVTAVMDCTGEAAERWRAEPWV